MEWGRYKIFNSVIHFSNNQLACKKFLKILFKSVDWFTRKVEIYFRLFRRICRLLVVLTGNTSTSVRFRVRIPPQTKCQFFQNEQKPKLPLFMHLPCIVIKYFAIYIGYLSLAFDHKLTSIYSSSELHWYLTLWTCYK